MPVVRTSHAGVNSKLLAPRKLYEISKYFNRALVAALEGSKSSAKHSNPALSHTVLQLWPLCPIFHCWTPATVHSSSVELRCFSARVFDRSFNGVSFDDHDGPVLCCSAVPLSNNCQSCRTRDKWWEAAGCVDRTDRVQLQPQAKLVAIQTEVSSSVFHTTSQRPAYVALCDSHSQLLS